MLRRRFLVICSGLASSTIAVLLAIPCVRYIFAPLRKHRKQAEFHRVALLASLPINQPTRLTIVADRRDTFTYYPQSPIGHVWLKRRQNTEGKDEIDCWQTICPHLGCGIELRPGRGFTCPCHNSDFDSHGRCINGPSPRNMDRLETRLTKMDNNKQVWVEVRYQKFDLGISVPRAKS